MRKKMMVDVSSSVPVSSHAVAMVLCSAIMPMRKLPLKPPAKLDSDTMDCMDERRCDGIASLMIVATGEFLTARLK